MSDAASSALIGYTGFVGGNLLRQRPFDTTFNSSNIEDIAGRSFDLVVCAGARAEKWRANANPAEDRLGIDRLSNALCRANIRRLVLISTVDVFVTPVDVDEDSPTPMEGLHAYGSNRRHLERVLDARFHSTIVRLPGLYGSGLKKNAIHDLMHDHEVQKIDSRGVFQFYNIDRLWSDVGTAIANDVHLVHLSTEPVSIAGIARAAFGREFVNEVAPQPARYDVQTRYAALFGGHGAPDRYIEDRTMVLNGIAAFAASERG